MSVIKLHYFNLAGAGENIRICFHTCGANFEDVRYDHNPVEDESVLKWQEHQHKFPLKQLPVLEVDGVYISQHMAILRYAGKCADLYPQDPMDTLVCDSLIEVVSMDIINQLVASFKCPKENRPIIRQQMMVSWATYLTKINAQYEGKEWLLDQMYICDMVLWRFATWILMGVIDGIPPEFLDTYPNIIALKARCDDHPIVKAYYASKGAK